MSFFKYLHPSEQHSDLGSFSVLYTYACIPLHLRFAAFNIKSEIDLQKKTALYDHMYALLYGCF